jgi:hypothetical protein
MLGARYDAVAKESAEIDLRLTFDPTFVRPQNDALIGALDFWLRDKTQPNTYSDCDWHRIQPTQKPLVLWLAKLGELEISVQTGRQLNWA